MDSTAQRAEIDSEESQPNAVVSASTSWSESASSPVTLSPAAFYLTALAAGFCMMGLEILAGPMLDPVFGSGKDVWAGIISVFILSLSVGYSLGGWLADRYNTPRVLGFALFAAGVLYCLMPTYAWLLIETLSEHIHTMRTGALIASMALFFLPSVLLGTVTPMLVKFVFHGVSELGRTTGSLYSVAAVGNVVGVLVTNFFLLDWFGLTGTLLGMGTVLMAFGLLLSVGARRVE